MTSNCLAEADRMVSGAIAILVSIFSCESGRYEPGRWRGKLSNPVPRSAKLKTRNGNNLLSQPELSSGLEHCLAFS